MYLSVALILHKGYRESRAIPTGHSGQDATPLQITEHNRTQIRDVI